MWCRRHGHGGGQVRFLAAEDIGSDGRGVKVKGGISRGREGGKNAFPSEQSLLRLAGSILRNIIEEWTTEKNSC